MTSPDNCFDEMAKVLFPHETSEDVGYIRLLEEVKRIKNIQDENKKLKNKLITANKKLKELKKENEELKETYFQKGFDAGKEEYEVDKEFLNEKDEENEGLKKKLDEGTEQHLADTKKLNKFYMKTKEENDELKEQIAKQERWSRAKTEVNMFLSLQWKELITSQDLSQMSGLGKDLGTDIAIVDIAEKFVKHEQENKKLKEDLDGKEHWQQTVCDYMDLRDEWCHFDEWLRENIDEDDKKQEWVKIWMEKKKKKKKKKKRSGHSKNNTKTHLMKSVNILEDSTEMRFRFLIRL